MKVKPNWCVSEKIIGQKLEYGQLFLEKIFQRKIKIWMVAGREIEQKKLPFFEIR